MFVQSEEILNMNQCLEDLLDQVQVYFCRVNHSNICIAFVLDSVFVQLKHKILCLNEYSCKEKMIV